MALSVYVHIPYCLQRCRYCDFTTFEQSEIQPPEEYVESVLNEIRNRRHLWPHQEIKTLYFGGGTPSLIAPEHIVTICRELAKAGLRFRPESEVTIEINPATLTESGLEIYLSGGVNRFSVGAQTFNDDLLKVCGRRHSAADTRTTLALLNAYKLNYSFDLLFALPGQNLSMLRTDLEEVSRFQPPHLSAYCLTIPEGHPMSQGRPIENEQIEMFRLIEFELKSLGLLKYEISNFAKPGFESKHNMTYWRDESYWGIGLSSHSYLKEGSPHGLRFWNPKSLAAYAQQAAEKKSNYPALLPADQIEVLKENEALTDFCHMFLRTSSGLPEEALRNRFASDILETLVRPRLETLSQRGLLNHIKSTWSLSPNGQLLSNKVFEELTFLQ